MRLPRITILALVFSIFSFVAAHAGENISQLLGRIEAKTYSYTSLRADFTQTLLHKQSGTAENRSGTISLLKPKLLRWETLTPAKELVVITDSIIWSYLADEEVAYKYPLELLDDSSTILRFVTGQAHLNAEFEAEFEGRQGGFVTLRLYPLKPQQTLVEAVIVVEEQSGILQQVNIIDFYGNENKITFSNMEFNVPLEKSSFTFDPPEGTDIEDRTSATVMEEKILQ